MSFKEEMRVYSMFFFLLFESFAIAYAGLAPLFGLLCLPTSYVPDWAWPFGVVVCVVAIISFFSGFGLFFTAIDEYEKATKRIDAHREGQPNESEGA